jgi:hypothetical protein
MYDEELQRARSLFRARIDSLRNDVMRCFWPIASASPIGGRSPAVVYNPPQFSPFPAIMYCFSTVDYFSSFWEGWNDGHSAHHPAGRSQTHRIVDFLCTFVRYPRREAYVAVNLWRHKLMHTAEPRLLTTGETPARVFQWLCGPDVESHMRLRQPDSTKSEYVLPFGCNEFVRDLEEGVFGALGYFPALVRNDNYPATVPPPAPPTPRPPAPAAGAAAPAAPLAAPAGAGPPPPLPAAPPSPLQDNFDHCWNELEQYQINLAGLGL